MIEIYVRSKQRSWSSFDVRSVPRVGEIVVIESVEYTVTKVVYTLPDRYVNESIWVYVEPDEVTVPGGPFYD